MSDYNELLDILKHLLFERFYPMPQYTKGLLGDGLGNVQVPGRPDKSYARFNRGSTEFFEIFNVTVPQVNDWPIKIGEFPWAPGLTQVVGTDWEVYAESGWDSLGNTPPHAPTHEWPDGSPGVDPMNVHMRSIVPFRAYTLTGTTVYVNALEYEYNGSGHVWGGLPGVDLTPVISDTVTGTMRYAGVYLEPSTNVLGIVTGTTTVHSSALTPPLVQFPAGSIPAGRFRIYGNQTVISEADTVDARRIIATTRQTVVNTTRVTAAYTALVTDDNIFCDTDGGAYTVDLPAGIEGQHFRIINCGSSGNDVTLDGNGAETVRGAATQTISDSEIMIIVFNSTEGWW